MPAVPEHIAKGLTLAAMRAYVKDLGVDALRTNGYVFLKQFVEPYSDKRGKKSLCELATGGVGRATHFISHAQSETLADTLDVIEECPAFDCAAFFGIRPHER